QDRPGAWGKQLASPLILRCAARAPRHGRSIPADGAASPPTRPGAQIEEEDMAVHIAEHHTVVQPSESDRAPDSFGGPTSLGADGPARGTSTNPARPGPR